MATISRLYKDYETGARVVAEVERAGIPHSDISIIANNDSGWFDRNRSKRIDRDADGTDDRAEGAAAGAGIGATLGGVAGVLAGLGMLAIPGIGPVVAAGWLASTAAMAAAGGAAGGLIGALTQSGIGEREAHAYAEGVRRGGTLVTVRVPGADRTRLEAIMDRYDPLDTSIGFEDRAGDWSGDRIVAAFENADRARAAREGLVEAGIDNANIELLENRSDLDTWTAIKRHAVPDEDAHLYAEGLGRGNSIMIIQAAAGEHDRVVQVLSRFNPIDIDDHAAQWRKSGWSGVHPGKAAWDVQRQTATPSGTTAAPGTQEQVIPVYEEQLKVGKRVVEHGRVRVRVYTIEHPVQEGVTLREERVAVERRPVDRPASGLPGEAFRDRTIDLTTHREEPVIAKEARVKEEVVVRNEADQRTETLRDSVRRTEVEVEDDRATATTPPPRSNAPSQR
jgi:stress response protein YsnF